LGEIQTRHKIERNFQVKAGYVVENDKTFQSNAIGGHGYGHPARQLDGSSGSQAFTSASPGDPEFARRSAGLARAGNA